MSSMQRLAAVSVIALSLASAAQAQSPMSGYQTPAQRELYNTEPGAKNDSVLDATNPLDLLKRLRQATALEDATDPADAIDAALQGWEAQSSGTTP